MGLNKIILNIALAIVDFCTFFLRPVPNRITFISLTSDHLTSDFKRISDALQRHGGYELRYNLVVFKKNLWGDFLYFLNCLKQVVELKRSRLVILNDNNYVISRMKPQETIVLQVWHEAGAVKKFGNQIHRQYEIKNYNAIVASSSYWQSCYAQAFGVRPEQVMNVGMARIDDLLDQARMEANVAAFYERYPQTKTKRCVLYAPTFRGNIIDGFEVESLHLDQMADTLPDDVMILYKFHPLLGDIRFQAPNAIAVNQEDLYTLMHVSDCLISDYSSVIFDYALLKKPMISFVPDLEKYKRTIGLNMEYEKDFPGAICQTEMEVVDALRNLAAYDYEKLYDFQKKYIVHTDGKNTARIVRWIEQQMKQQKKDA